MVEFLVVIVTVLILTCLAIYFTYLYNRFQALKVAVDATMGQIQVALRKLLDMVTQLAEVAKKYAVFERETFGGIEGDAGSCGVGVA